MKLEWIAKRHKYSSGETLKLGPFEVGHYYWDTSPIDKDKPYKVCCYLPGFKSVLGNEPSIVASRERLERAVYRWISKALED